MRHQRTGKKLGRDSAHRRALYANLASELIEHERIKTTVTKAKAVKPIAEQMITLGRRGDIHARRQAVAFLRSKDIVHKLFTDLGPRFAERPGGYLRIVRLGPRQGDAAEMVYLELVDTPLVFKTKLEDVDAPIPGGPDSNRFQPQFEDADAEAEAEGDEPEPEAEADDEEPGAEAEAAVAEEAEVEDDAHEAEPAEEPAAEAETAEPEAEADAEPDEADAEEGEGEDAPPAES
jgi:large subunit ribosomal protein L17